MWIPYARPAMTEADISAATAVLKTPEIGQGNVVSHLEKALADLSGMKFAVVVNSGTAALHLAYKAIFGAENPAHRNTKPLILIPGIQFVSAASMAVLEGAQLLCGEIDAKTGNLDLDWLESELEKGCRPDVVCAVSYAGWPVDFVRLTSLSDRFHFRIIADQSHALGAVFSPLKDENALLTYSFQSLKHITSGEGGAVLTNSEELAERMKRLRSHGSGRNRYAKTTVYNAEDFYAEEIGFNYRLTDFQAALLVSQLSRLTQNLENRRAMAKRYHEKLLGISGLTVDENALDEAHALHLYTIRASTRDKLFQYLRAFEIGVQVHYVPLHRHLALKESFLPGFNYSDSAENFFHSILSLPLYEGLTFDQVDWIAEKIRRFYAPGC